jgi:hypothetical protein
MYHYDALSGFGQRLQWLLFTMKRLRMRKELWKTWNGSESLTDRATSKMEAAMHFRVYQVIRRTGVVRYSLSVSAPGKDVHNVDTFQGEF